jgi:hypothetical protein
MRRVVDLLSGSCFLWRGFANGVHAALQAERVELGHREIDKDVDALRQRAQGIDSARLPGRT